MSACEKCWRDASARAVHLGGHTVDHYHTLLRERAAAPCSPEEQAGIEVRSGPDGHSESRINVAPFMENHP